MRLRNIAKLVRKHSSHMLVVNLYPFVGGFHLTAGFAYNGNSLALSNGTYIFQQVGAVTVGMTFKSVAPYFGIGRGCNGS